MPTLDFNGKQFIKGHHLTVPIKTLEIDKEKSFTGESDPSLDDNLIIHGDNLEGLKALLPRYANSIKCIYIDPPYNTGNEGWKYNDNVNSPQIQAWLNKNVDAEDLERHDKWLCMMWPRLHLLKELLTDDGVLFISIDDNEQHRLRMLMDDIFGGQNFVTNIIWQKKFSPQNDAKYFSDNHDFVVCYAKNKETWRPVLLPRTEEHNKRYSNPDNDPRGPWSSSGLDVKTYQEEYDYPITTPSGRVVNPPPSRCWRCSKEKFDELINDNRIWFGEEGNNVPRVKRFLSEVKQGITPLTVWLHKDVGHTQSATQGLNKIGVAFSNPKPYTLIKRILQIGTDPNSIILDSFAGSGTTAHAVLALNKEDDGNRKFILIECENYADTITAERVRRVINGVENAKDPDLKEGLGGSFTYCTLGDTIDEIRILTEEPLPDYETVANYIAFVATGKRNWTPIKKRKDYCFGETKNILFYLIYEPSLEFMQSSSSALTYELAQKIEKTCKDADKKAYVYASHKNISQKDLSDMQITFCQLPYNIYRITE